MADKNARVLILAASLKDATSSQALLNQIQIESVICTSIFHLQEEMADGAGVLLLAKEVLNESAIESLSNVLKKQAPWSFIPIVLLVTSGDLNHAGPQVLQLLKPLPNITLLERPVRIGTLLSVIQANLADRQRQFRVRDLLEDLEKSRSEAISASEAKSNFLANMSHEIRTPLGAILGFSELLMEPAISERDKLSYVEVIKRSGQMLSALVADVLDLSKVEAGKISVESIDISLNELFSEVISTLEPRASAKNINLVIVSDATVPRKIKSDPVRLKQILINIIGNAIKFTSEGKVEVRVLAPPRFSEGKKTLRVQIKDSGLGISEAQAVNLFKPFAQADSSITRKYGGTGLGLALSKKLAQALGGDLTLLSSKLGEGSTFEISLDISSTSEELSEEAPHSLLPAISLNGVRVLVVDDSLDNQVLITQMLKLAGAETDVAGDGLEAMEKALQDNYDLILMDIQMPRLGGREATSMLRSQGYPKPIVALTAHAFKEDRDLCIAAGCDDYLTKPLHRFQLLQVVQNQAHRILS